MSCVLCAHFWSLFKRLAVQASTSLNDDQQHMLAAVRDENISSAATIEELFSLYQCPRCGQCSLFRTSSDDISAYKLHCTVFSDALFVFEHSDVRCLEALRTYIDGTLKSYTQFTSYTGVCMTVQREILHADGLSNSSVAEHARNQPNVRLATTSRCCGNNAVASRLIEYYVESTFDGKAMKYHCDDRNRREVLTCRPFSIDEDPHASMLNVIQYVNQQLNASPTAARALSTHTLPTQAFTLGNLEGSCITNAGVSGFPNFAADSASLQAALLEERQAGWQQAWKTCPPTIARHSQKVVMMRLRQPDSISALAIPLSYMAVHSSPSRCNITSSRRDKQRLCFTSGMGNGIQECVCRPTESEMWLKVVTIAHHMYDFIEFTMISPFLIKMVYSHGAHASSFCESQTSGLVSGMVDSGLSSVAHSIDSSRRSSENTCNYDTSVDMGHDDGCWSAPPAGPRPVRGAGHSMSLSGLKTDNYFTFEPLSPLQSESPASAVCGSNETSSSESKPVFSSPRHQNKQQMEIEKITNESPPTSGTTGSLSAGRKHNPVFGGGLRGLSFWPSEKCREAPNDPSDRRKVVNRKGNIFQPRMSFNIFEKLPPYKRNPYFIHMDDDSCTGNEDTRAFLLAQLTNHRVSEVCCIICHQALVIYDHFPVIDGLFFISPICHRAGKASGLRVSWHTNGIAPTFYQNTVVGANCDPEQLVKNEQAQKLLSSSKSVIPPPGCLGPRQQLSVSHLSDQAATGTSSYRNHAHPPRQERYLHAVCMGCMHNSITEQEAGGTRAHCRNCNRPWSGSHLLVGGLYTYDVFAAFLCCSKQLTCNACESRLDVRENLSQGSSIGAKLTTTATQASSSSSLQRIEDRTPQDPSFNAQTTVETMSATFDNPDDHLTSFPLPFFSQYSQLITCLFCAKVDYHFVKPFEKRFRTQRCPSN
ncbi:headcase protein [Clonorchis sinensis]|uniref:Headcase protein n=1 Tax=Clonorchis sinensis TaxID=79923 RepID=G7Y879_CLOSI|nr:headcase protein [Clonorchis sinensis]